MRRWNGWGDDSYTYEVSSSARHFIRNQLGEGAPLPEATLESVLKKVPASRLPDHPLVTRESLDRVLHARGHSLPDWLAMKGGSHGVFPDGVAYPQTGAEVKALLQFAAEVDCEVIPWGGGTSVVGHVTPRASTLPILTISLARMNRLLNLDQQSQLARFGAGANGPEVEAQLRAHGYTLGHFPQSFELSTLGGWIASRSSGQQSLRYGRIEQLFAGGILETPVGTLEMPTFPASAAGPDIREMVLGSEGRLGILTEVQMRVTALPEKEDFYTLFFPDWQRAQDASRSLVQSGIQLSMLRLSSPIETESQLALAGHPMLVSLLERYLALRGAGAGKCMMTLGITGSKSQCRAARRQVTALLRKFDGVSTGRVLGRKWAEKRFLLPYLRETLWQLGYAVDTMETATDWDNVDCLMNRVEDNLRQQLRGYGERVHVFSHLSHLYPQGCSIYTTCLFRCADSYEETLRRWQQLKSTTSALIVNNHGTISHQHGVGKDHAPYLSVEKGPLGIQAIEGLCQRFDPDQRMNPGTLVDGQGCQEPVKEEA